jgi:hypothetical protein
MLSLEPTDKTPILKVKRGKGKLLNQPVCAPSLSSPVVQALSKGAIPTIYRFHLPGVYRPYTIP